MERYSRKEDEEGYHQFLNLLPKEDNMEWFVRNPQETNHYLSEDEKLELTLAPPGGGKIICFRTRPCAQNPVLKPPPQTKPHYFHNVQSSGQRSVMEEESLHRCRNRVEEESLQISDIKAFQPAEAPAKTAVPKPNSSSSQKRIASAQVVGWPPIRSSRKNFSSGSSSRIAPDSTNMEPDKKQTQNCMNSLFVKINMDGIPIGRKVDLKAFDSYEKLEYAVDELFRDLSAQSECSAEGIDAKMPREMSSGFLKEYEEYTLVYEDNEGDRMLVGDVPWHMFVSTVKRLRVLRSSELSTLSCALPSPFNN